MSMYWSITGKSRIRIEGAMPLSFVSEIRRTYAVRDIRSEDEFSCELTVKIRESKAVTEFAKQRGFKVQTLKNSGFYCFVQKALKRPGMVLGAALMAGLIYASSLFVWDVNIIGNNSVTDNDIKKGLRQAGLYEGVLKSKVDPGSVRNRYIISDRRISWMSVILYGTAANVEVIESEIAPPREDKAPMSNIVALRDGIIERVDAVWGQSVVEPGQVVSKGELLVSAVVKTRKENELLTGARASVWARTQRTFQVRVPLVNNKKHYTGNKVNRYTVMVMGKDIELPHLSRLDDTIFDCTYEIITPKVFGSIELPFVIKKEVLRGYGKEKAEISIGQGRKKAEAEMSALIEREIGSAPVVNKEMNFEITDSTVILTCNIECVENIAKKVPVTFSS